MDNSLNKLILVESRALECPDTIVKPAILHALAEVESDHGRLSGATRHENAYCYGGFYYRAPTGDDLRRLSGTFGCLAHCSYSSWQILYITAYEEGFRGDPCELRNDAAAIPYVIRLLNRRIFARYPRIVVESVADAYNSGRPYDKNKPEAYIQKFVEAYDRWKKEFPGVTGPVVA